MSIGNTKDYGNKGNNFPFQRSVLKLLSDISCTGGPGCCPNASTETTLAAVLASLVSIDTKLNSPVAVTLPGGTQVINSSTVAVSGATAGGETSVTFSTDSSFTGSINGATREPNSVYSFEAAVGKVLPVINYVVTTGTVTIDTIT